MIVKLLVLSPFELAYSNRAGRYTVGDNIPFDISKKDDRGLLVKLLSDGKYKNMLQCLDEKKMDEALLNEIKPVNRLLQDGVAPKKEELDIKAKEQEQLDQMLKPAALVNPNPKSVVEKLEEVAKDRKVVAKPVVEEKPEVKEEEPEVDVKALKEARYQELDEMHWATLRKLAEEEYNLTYPKFDKDKAIADILRTQFS